VNQLLRFDKEKIRNKVTVSHLGNNELLIEGDVSEAKFIAENSEFDLSAVDIKDGPKIVIGKDFLGQGYVDHISVLRLDPSEPLLLKIKLAQYS
jgi:hypothetical protein